MTQTTFSVDNLFSSLSKKIEIIKTWTSTFAISELASCLWGSTEPFQSPSFHLRSWNVLQQSLILVITFTCIHSSKPYDLVSFSKIIETVFSKVVASHLGSALESPEKILKMPWSYPWKFWFNWSEEKSWHWDLWNSPGNFNVQPKWRISGLKSSMTF